MVNLVSADFPESNKKVQQLADDLKNEFPFITTIIHNINRKKAQIAFGDEEKIIYGPGFVEEKLAGLKFRISANSFFQTNSLQAKQMYELIAAWGSFNKDHVVYDLYAGTGSIGIFISRLGKKVIGFELIPQAISDAKINAKLNEIDNCEFIQGDLLKSLTDVPKVIDQIGKPDVVIIDPPRSGMHPKLPEKIIQLNPQKIIYVSCNPATLTRDLKVLCERFYHLVRIQAIDMFPHTAHCETVALLEKV
jgi:23S rRNA (uracil1939-C5)-methyltransferase